ncbi:hypothetical protein VB712_10735 [Spirulina sp. CCNP1310]|uniref:hypothetical protein n=1 Tax=Spirulina sp. CCNP1310 TaxID=3110249 RepID=UPI002B21991D|nr:hypothetical protein [Spirulina sp. CCNP1310]MEA5419698.1 hypothetical protein [Spirulina sp. CCNP1310]
MPSQIITQLKILETLYQQGQSNPTLENTLTKIIQQELLTLKQQQAELQTDIQQLEQRHQMSSSELYQQFHQGQLSDDLDFIEWNAYHEMHNTLQQHINLLESSLTHRPHLTHSQKFIKLILQNWRHH